VSFFPSQYIVLEFDLGQISYSTYKPIAPLEIYFPPSAHATPHHLIVTPYPLPPRRTVSKVLIGPKS
jgi:hypothetical protein